MDEQTNGKKPPDGPAQQEPSMDVLNAARRECEGFVSYEDLRRIWRVFAAHVPVVQEPSEADKFCDTNCTWLDHAPGCAYGVNGLDVPERVEIGSVVLPGISGEEYDDPEFVERPGVLELLQERLVRNGKDRHLSVFVEVPAAGVPVVQEADPLREALHLIASTTNDPGAREEANRALGVAPTAVPDLHAAIMNLPCRVPDTEAGSKHHAIWASGYKMGHRDARHAAAEQVAAGVARLDDQTKT